MFVYNHTEVIFLKRIIEKLIRSNLFDYEQIGYDNNEIKHIVKSINENRQMLFDTLSDKQKEFFYKYEDFSDERLTLREISAFSEGFRLGAKILIDVLYDEE